jgi:hypothetical protein
MIESAGFVEGGSGFANIAISAPNVFLFLVVAGAHLWFAAIVVWAIWIKRFVEARADDCTSSLTFFSGLGALRDYIAAKRIRTSTQKPWFLRTFECLAGTGVTCIFLAIVHIVWIACA